MKKYIIYFLAMHLYFYAASQDKTISPTLGHAHDHTCESICFVEPDSIVQMNVYLPFDSIQTLQQVGVKDGVVYFQGDIILGNYNTLTNQNFGMGVNGKRWTNSTVRYFINTGFSNNQINQILKAADEIAYRTDLCFERIFAPSGNYVNVVTGAGCASYVGMVGGAQNVTLAPNCTTPAIIHEFLHASGLWHEQSRPDRDNHITVNWHNIQSGREHNFQIQSGIMLGNYDVNSIMHYYSLAFSKNGQPTIVKKNGSTIPYIYNMSAGDVASINQMYGAANIPANTTTYTNELGWIYNHGNSWYTSSSSDGKESVNMTVNINNSNIQHFCSDGIWGYTNELGWIYFRDASGANYAQALGIWAYFNSPPSNNGVWFYTYDQICTYSGWFYANPSSGQSGAFYSSSKGGWLNSNNCQNFDSDITFLTPPDQDDIPTKQAFTDTDQIPDVPSFDNEQLARMPTALQPKMVSKVYPNPTSKELNIEYNCSGTSDLQLNLYSLTGRLVQAEKVSCLGKNTYTLKLNHSINTGVYFIEITSAEGIPETHKIIVE